MFLVADEPCLVQVIHAGGARLVISESVPVWLGQVLLSLAFHTPWHCLSVPPVVEVLVFELVPVVGIRLVRRLHTGLPSLGLEPLDVGLLVPDVAVRPV